ncbi:MAG TPA: response regulator [Rhizomicrobium sp.]
MLSEPGTFNGLTALVVEDEILIAFLIQDMLKDAGFGEVIQAGSIGQAFAILEKMHPDVAILDLNLAGEPAYPVAEHLQSLGIPFAFASGYGMTGVSGAWAQTPVIQKPFQAEVLLDTLSALLHRTGPASAG